MEFYRHLPKAISMGACLALLIAAPGCTFLKDLIGAGPQRPVVKVIGIEVSRATIAAIDLSVTLQVDNPNSFDLKLSRLKYSVDALGMPVADGFYDDTVIIEANKRGNVKLPVRINAQNAVELAKAFLQSSKELTALVRATALFDSPVGEMEVEFEDRQPLSRIGGI